MIQPGQGAAFPAKVATQLPTKPEAQAVGDARRRREGVKGVHPLAWDLFQRFTLELIERGFAHYSADAVFHRVRWETAVTTDDGNGFKVNNDLSPRYARMFHQAHPAYAGFFRTRVSKYDAKPAPASVPGLRSIRTGRSW
jgi:hypothetical protein